MNKTGVIVMSKAPSIDLVEAGAKRRREPPVPRKFIQEAARRIESGEESVEVYPGGLATLKGTYDLAARIEADSSVKN